MGSKDLHVMPLCSREYITFGISNRIDGDNKEFTNKQTIRGHDNISSTRSCCDAQMQAIRIDLNLARFALPLQTSGPFHLPCHTLVIPCGPYDAQPNAFLSYWFICSQFLNVFYIIHSFFFIFFILENVFFF